MFRFKFTTIFLSLLGAMFLTNAVKDPSNPPTGKTGAPGEQTCSTTPGCHNGGNYTGSIKLTGIPDTVVAGETYQLTYEFASAAVRTGFEITCLDETNMTCGSIIAGSGSNIKNDNSLNRSYIRQTTAKFLANGVATWGFSWKAPNTGTQTSATFYMAGLAGNGNGNDSGDNAITGTHTIHFPMTSAAPDQKAAKLQASVSPNPSNGIFQVQSEGLCDLSIFTLNGKKIKNLSVQNAETLDLSSLGTGAYYFQFTEGKKTTIQRVNVVR